MSTEYDTFTVQHNAVLVLLGRTCAQSTLDLATGRGRYPVGLCMSVTTLVCIYNTCHQQGNTCLIHVEKVDGNDMIILYVMHSAHTKDGQPTLGKRKRVVTSDNSIVPGSESLIPPISRRALDAARRQVQTAIATYNDARGSSHASLEEAIELAAQCLAIITTLRDQVSIIARTITTLVINVCNHGQPRVGVVTSNDETRSVDVANCIRPIATDATRSHNSNVPPPLVLAMRLSNGLPFDIHWLVTSLPSRALQDGILSIQNDKVGKLLSLPARPTDDAARSLGLSPCVLLLGMGP